MTRNNMGQVRIIEAFLAAVLIFSALVFSPSLQSTQNASGQEHLASLGMQALMTLDGDGVLGSLIDKRNWTGLCEMLRISLPIGVSFNVTVYDDLMLPINEVVISNGGLGSNEIASVNYLCVSQGLTCSCYVVRLQLATAGG